MSIYEIVTEKVLEQMKQGVIPWQKPWFGSQSGAVSYETGRPYSLLNQMLLGKSGEWLTFNQIHKHGGCIKKGESPSYVTFWKTYLKGKDGELVDNTGDEEPIENAETKYVLRYYKVWHISQTDGIKSKIKEEEPNIVAFTPSELAENAINGYFERENCKLKIELSNRAYYSSTFDEVVCPKPEQFELREEYYSTLFHEMTHSTGHRARLDRFKDGSHHFGSVEYSKEELVAEMGSAFLVNRFGLESEKSFKNSIAYLQSWIKAIREDSKLIIFASSLAEKAALFILNEKKEN